MRMLFREWSAFALESAQRRGIKVTPKNMAKLRDTYVSWYLDLYGHTFQNMFAAVYADHMIDEMEKRDYFIKKIPKDEAWVGSSMIVPIKFGGA